MKTYSFKNRELRWLDFNDRVLQEAEDPTVPLIERLRFIGIFSNNLDEFYKIRYATVKRIALSNQKEPIKLPPVAMTPNISRTSNEMWQIYNFELSISCKILNLVTPVRFINILPSLLF